MDFSCDGNCSTDCVPDTVTVRIRNYQFPRFMSFLGLPPVPLPDFRTSLPMEGAGCDPEQIVPAIGHYHVHLILIASTDEQFRELIRDNLLNQPNAEVIN